MCDPGPRQALPAAPIPQVLFSKTGSVVRPQLICYVGNQTLSPTLAGMRPPPLRKKQEDQSATECGQPDQRDHERDIVMGHARQPSEKAAGLMIQRPPGYNQSLSIISPPWTPKSTSAARHLP
jgi:hypothetical protein